MRDPCVGFGWVMLLVAIAVAFRLWQGKSFLTDFGEQDAGQPVPLPDPRKTSEPGGDRMGFGAIRFADPHFDLDVFYARVTEMFLAYHAAAQRGDLKPARRFIDERYYAQLLQQLQAERASASARGPASAEQLTVESARALTASHEAGMDMVRVLITAHRGGESGPHVQEYWTLIRRQGAITKADLSLYKCPNCGAPTDGEDPTRCGYCGARLADPALDWVVTRIRTDD